MKEDEGATGGGKRMSFSGERKRAVGIFISCLGLIIVASHLIGELLQTGSLTDLLQHWIKPSMIVHLSIELLTIPAFMLIGYFYQKQQNLAENLENLVEERTERLLESQTRLKNIFAASPDAITVTDLNGNIIECNQATLDMHGYSWKEELIGKNTLELIEKKDHKRAMENRKKTLEQGLVRNIESTFLTKDGHEFPAELSVSVIKDASGKPTGFVAITKDITERKKAEEALRNSEAKYRNFVEKSYEGVWEIDGDGVTVFANPRMAQILGYHSPDEMIGRYFYEFDTNRSRALHLLERRRSGIAEVYDAMLQRKDGSIVYVIMSTVPHLDEAGNFTGATAFVTDISERKRAEEALRESEEKFRNIFDSANDSITYLDRSGRILDVNKKAMEVFGGSRKELLGKHFTRVGIFSLREIPTLMTNFANILAGKNPTLNVCIKNKKGQEIPLECSASLMKTDGKLTGIMVIARDVTERKKAEEKLRFLKDFNERIVNSIGDALLVIDPYDYTIISANEVALKQLKLRKEDLIGKTCYETTHHRSTPCKPPHDICPIQEMLKTGKAVTVEHTHFDRDNNEIYVEVSASPVRNQEGNIVQVVHLARDITERKQMEEKLKESEESFRNLYESIQDPVGVYVGREGRLIEYNKAFNKMSGYTDEELKDKTFLDFVHPDDQAMVLEKYRIKYPEEELPLVYEIRGVNKKGEIIPLEISVSTYKVKGKVVGIEVIHRDITKRKKAEEALRESEEKFRDIFESANDALVYGDLTGRILDINRKAQELAGIKKEEVLGKHFWKLGLVSQKDVPKLLGLLTRKVEGKLTTGFELMVTRKDGEKRFIEVNTALIRTSKAPRGFLAIVRDITERKKMEEKLRQYSEHLEELVRKRTEEMLESEKRYSVLVEEASDGVIIGQDGKIVFANKRAAEIFGYSRDELIGLPFKKILDEKYLQLAKERYMRILRGEKVPVTYEVEIVTKTGERVQIEGSPTLIHYQGRPAALVIVRDITERKRMEEERLKLEKLATIGELATMVGHDLRNPLQSIENATYYLNNELPRLPPSTPIPQKAIEMLQVINDSVNYADKIIRDLHDFSATKKPVLKKTNINAIVKETLSQVETPENVKLITELGHLPKIKADKDMIKRAFMNLTVNGIQAMKKGGTLKVSTKKTKGSIEVRFKDTGTGISKQNMKKIFTPFFTTRAKGMGMGLPVCKKFVEIHGGSIEVESEEGKGSTFTVKLPIQQ